MQQNNKLAIIAGNGELPVLLAKSACEQGFNTCALAVTEEANRNLEGLCDKVYKVSPVQVTKMLDLMKTEMVNQAVFIGKVPKLDLLRNIHKLDWLALKYMSTLTNFNDDSIHKAVINLLKKYDVKVLPQTMFLKHLFLEKEVLSKRKPTLEERIDIEYGYDVAKKVSSLDIGQTVVVKNKMILAIEAIEGTDEAIKRGCLLFGKEVIVVKVAKPNQDERFDIPTIGENTIEILGKNGGGILAFEANKTIVTNKEEIIKSADKMNICLIAI
ncbi:MAG: UDP-2,3-diacylglucosamine diphosphatase LpxI [Candidatus Melainabacteria bacterium]|nr:UDP-2,3-diacylglucosamine diphosphatase LpxI [Candidatus Melainabacteria bacterium]